LRTSNKDQDDDEDDDDDGDYESGDDDEDDENYEEKVSDKKEKQTKAKTTSKPVATKSAEKKKTPAKVEPKPDFGRSESGAHSLRNATQKEKIKSKLGRSLSGMHSSRLQEKGKPKLPKEVLEDAQAHQAGTVLVVRTPEVKAVVCPKKTTIKIDGFYICVVQAGKKPRNGYNVKWLNSSSKGKELLYNSTDPWYTFKEEEGDLDIISQDTVLCSATTQSVENGYKISSVERNRILKLLLEEHMNDATENELEAEIQDDDK